MQIESIDMYVYRNCACYVLFTFTLLLKYVILYTLQFDLLRQNMRAVAF